jgi:hypothetical protein
MRCRLPFALVVAAAMAACHPSARQERADTAVPDWRLGPAPLLTIGGNGSTETEFSRVAGAWRLSNGAIGVANAGSGETRIFDARGTFAHALGRTGGGPGEFRDMGWTRCYGDTVAIYDRVLRRITTILEDGAPRLLATLPLTIRDDRAINGVTVEGRLPDGRWLVRAELRPDLKLRGVQRIPSRSGLAASSGTGSIEWLTEAPDMAVIVSNPAGSQKMVDVVAGAFPPSFIQAVSGSAVWFGDTATDTIVRIDVATGARKTIKLLDPAAPVTRAMVDAARARDLAAARSPKERELVEVEYAAANVPPRLPAFEALVPGTAGELWVQIPAASRSAPARYLVLSASGSAIARVAVPAGFRAMDIGRDYVVGLHQDADGVEAVQTFALTR